MTSGPRPPRTLVIIPAKNEERALPGVLSSLRDTVPELDIVVVDDGSTDATAAVAREHGAAVLSLPFNLGIGGALRTGFRYAVDRGYSRGIQFDGDGQHEPSQIALLLRALDDGADMAIGNRFGGPGQSYQLSRVRAQAMGFLRFLVRQFSGTRFTDTSSGFRAFNRDVLEFFARDYPAEYLESVESLLLACGAGFRVDEIPVQMHRRAQGAPSNRRLHLLFHYVRVTLVITVTATRRRRGPSVRPAGVPDITDLTDFTTVSPGTGPARPGPADRAAGRSARPEASGRPALVLDGPEPWIAAILAGGPGRAARAGVGHQAGRIGGLVGQSEPFVEGDLSTRGHVFVVIVTTATLVYVLRLVRRRRMSGRYALLWTAVSLALMVLAVWPGLLTTVSELVGVHYPPTLFLLVLTGFLFVVVIHFSYELTRLEDRSRILAEEVALLRAERELTPSDEPTD